MVSLLAPSRQHHNHGDGGVALRPGLSGAPAQLHHRVSWAELLGMDDAETWGAISPTCQERCLVQRESAFAKRIRQ